MKLSGLALLTLAVALLVAISISLLDPERLSALGSILAGAGSLMAVIWFSAGLRYQATQLAEQRKQFTAQFEHLCETSRRDALLLAKSILDKAETSALAHHGQLSTLAELVPAYMNFAELKPLLESTDPMEVLDAYRSWFKKEGAALTLVQGIKAAAEVYFRSIGLSDIDYSKPPEEFVFIYSPRFSNQPFFQSVSGTAVILAEVMFTLAPARSAAVIALFAATAKGASMSFIKADKLSERMNEHKARDYPLPAIARDL